MTSSWWSWERGSCFIHVFCLFFLSFFFFSFKNLKRSETNELIYKTETDSQTQNEFMVGDGGREEWGKESGSLGPPEEHRELCSM